MIDLKERVFGGITAQQVFGSEPPPGELEGLFEAELRGLLAGLDSLDGPGLAGLKERQKGLDGEINGRPGAMALSQEKIRLYLRFSREYISRIEEKLGT
ncbi:hypothetical protein CENSYa_1820 [Cenarchaeum symbiosum A]|uniref:Uncharacterized protein n=1 Tax=Cenarchaeum symbiosum (strain A) TaxID=414004 RepID=A0RYL3_CENSY|nr:hypothetical protein CENSYa_1820 [Cenarchaeum symbiosum A]